MSIETEFESTITNVKNAYQGLDNLGTTIPQNKTIENIKNCLDEIYNKFPKTSYAEGSNITLSNTLKGKLDFEDGIVGYGQTSQKSYEGYQLLNYTLATLKALNTSGTWNNNVYTLNGLTFTVNEDLTIIVNGTSTANTDFNIQKFSYTNGNEYTLVDELDDNLYGKYTMMIASFSQWGQNTIITDKYITFTASTTAIINTRIVVYNNNTLSNKIFKPMLYSGAYDSSKTFEPYVGGTASPNPPYPQDIEVVRGKNLLEIKLPSVEQSGITMTNNEDGSITFKGTATNNVNFRIDQTSVSSDNNLKTYIAPYSIILSKVEGTPTGTMYLGGYSDSDSWITPSCNIGATRVLQINCKNAFCYIRFDNGTVVNETIYPMIVKGTDVNTPYLPYNTLEVVERGKNLFNPDVTGLFKAWCNATENNGEITITATQNGDIYVGNVLGVGNTYVAERGKKVYVKPNTRYTIVSTNNNVNKILFTEFDSNNISLGYVQANTLITKANTSYITIRYGLENAVNGTSYKTKIMVAEGTDTTYEPYQTPQTYQLSLGEYEFAKIGNYVDTIEYDVDEDKVYKNEVINKYQFTGNELFGKSSSTNLNGYIFNFSSVTTNILVPANNGTKANILSNAFITKAVDTIIGEATYGIGIRSDRGLYIGAPLGSFENVSALQTYLANNITFMYYTLTTPVKKEITGTLADQIKALYNSHSFTGTTILESNGNLPLIIKVRANSEGVVPSGSISIASNGTHDVTNYATANVNVTPSTETKTVKSTTTSQTVNPTSGKLISQITVQPITLDIVNVTPSTSSQTITPTNDGIGQVNVSAVTSSIDNNIVAGNIKKDVSILGVTGTYEGGGSSEYNAKIDTTLSPSNYSTIYNYLKEIPLVDTSSRSDMGSFFYNCASLTTIPLIETSNAKSMKSMFEGCTGLTTIPLLNTSEVTNMQKMFNGCKSLTTIPVFNTSKVINMQNMFSSCNSLSDETLNNILEMCINATSYTSTLSKIGISSNLANRCVNLSNYQAFLDAGWTTGY